MICTDRNASICDDGIEKLCSDISISCPNIHKHLICNNVTDCKDKSDEDHIICRKLTEATCQRRVGPTGELKLPLAWLGDGTVDCEDSSDEQEYWPFCGVDKTRRNVTSNETCENVFVCPFGEPGFIELNELCDGLETCGNENQVCSVGRRSETLSTSVLSTDYDLTKNLSYCLKGMEDLLPLMKDNCYEEHFIFPNHQYFGV